MAKLRVLRTVWEAYRAVVVNLRRLAVVAVIPAGLMVLGGAADALLRTGIDDFVGTDVLGRRPPWATILWTTMRLVPYEIPVALFMVPCYRVFLLGSFRKERRDSVNQVSIYRNMILITLALHVVFYVPFLSIDHFAVKAEPSWVRFLEFVYPILYLLTLASLTFAFPVISLGRPLELEERLGEIAGNFWRLCAALSIALLPLGMLAVWLHLVVFGVSLPGDGGPEEETMKNLMFLVPFTIAMETLWAAVTVVAFATLTGYPAKGVRVPGARS